MKSIITSGYRQSPGSYSVSCAGRKEGARDSLSHRGTCGKVEGREGALTWTTNGFRRCRFRNFLGFGRKKSDCICKETALGLRASPWGPWMCPAPPQPRWQGANPAYADGVQVLAERQFCLLTGRVELAVSAVGWQSSGDGEKATV